MLFLIPLFAALNLVSLSSLVIASPFNTRHSTSTCHCIPGDSCWPSDSQWASLNETIKGQLIKTVPLGSVCHDPTFNAAACAALQASWSLETTHYPAPAELMEPFFQNGSCTPFTPKSQPCELGYYPDYSVNVTGAGDIIAGLAFAKEKNVRISIKNTGHDYLGRSSGQGSLSLWTHNLKDITFSNYESAKYTGPAVKIGAGVQAFEAYEAAAAKGLRVVGGECPSVGLAGGYTQGGGHSALSSTYGLGADQTLEWEVVTAAGKVVTASPSENSELYWALSGGGPGNYGVVLSLTVKAHLDGVVGGALITYAAANVSQDVYWQAFEAYHAALPPIVDKGIMAAVIVSPINATMVFTYPNSTISEVTSILQPYLNALNALALPYSFTPTVFPTYYEHFVAYFGPIPDGIFAPGQPTGSHLLPRSSVVDPTSNRAYTAAIREIISSDEMAVFTIGVNVNHTVAGNTPSSNAVLPAWRKSIAHVFIGGITAYDAPIEQHRAAQQKITDDYQPVLVAAIPNSGAYMNEADFQEANWKVDFYGENYDALKDVKDKWDPNGLFYVQTGVGSNEWQVDGQGRLCRA